LSVSDFRINSGVRSVIARNWIDLQKLKFGSFRGTVRITGNLSYLGARTGAACDSGKLEALEAEIRRVPGVGRVYLDLTNWRRSPTGQWECTDGTPQHAAVTDVEEEARPVPGLKTQRAAKEPAAEEKHP
jgi:hypothetical protein